ncbi:hypothetical protein [Streptomyces sp. NPDC059861]
MTSPGRYYLVLAAGSPPVQHGCMTGARTLADDTDHVLVAWP